MGGNAQAEEKSSQAEGAPPPICIWYGAAFGGWIRLLARNRFAVGRSYCGRAFLITWLSLVNSALGAIERLKYRRRVAAVELEAPLFIIGHWRSGTTLLHEYLARDPRHCFPRTYDCFAPSHFLLTGDSGPARLNALLPDRRPMDAMALDAELPQEDDFALALLGQPSLLVMIAFPNNLPGDGALFDLRALPPRRRAAWRRCLKGFLRKVAYRSPGARLVLKSPIHTARIPDLLEVFPDARFVYIHRDPYEVYPSTLHMVKALHPYIALQDPRHDDLESLALANGEMMFRRYEEDRSLLPEGRLHEIAYQDLVRDPVAALEELYRALGLGGFEPVRETFREMAEERRAYRPQRHELPDALRRELDARWPDPCRRYGHIQ